jgi:hypothetical protein
MTQTPTAPVVPHGYELKKKKSLFGRWWFWLAIIIVAVIIGTQASGGSGGSASGSSSDESGPAAGMVEVIYTVESDAASVSSTYTTLNGGNIGQEQSNNVAPPFTKTYQVEDSFLQSFTMTASTDPVFDGSAQANHSITCRITVDGEVVAEQTSTGQFAMVTCNAS